jgi:hypothetical protein
MARTFKVLPRNRHEGTSVQSMGMGWERENKDVDKVKSRQRQTQDRNNKARVISYGTKICISKYSTFELHHICYMQHFLQ